MIITRLVVWFLGVGRLKRAAGKVVSCCAAIILLTMVFIVSQGVAFAQGGDAPAFEVTSIKLSKLETTDPLIGISPGRLTLTGFNLKMLMVYAYWIHPDQVQKTSGWMDSEKFDIVAKPERAVSQDQLRRMLQVMLTERFKLTFHHEQKELPIYTLTVAKGGSKMKARMPGDGGPGFRLVYQGNSLPGRNASISELIFVLQTRVLDRPVIDETSLNGRFDFDLSWSPDRLRGDTPPTDSDNPDLFTAVQNQLGLKLDSRRGPAEVLVVDHAEEPDAN